MTNEKRQKLVDLLAHNPYLINAQSRVTLLNESDLQRFIPRLNFDVSPNVFASLLMRELEYYGGIRKDGELWPAWIILLVFVVRDMVEGVDRTFIEGLLDETHVQWRATNKKKEPGND